MIQEETDTKALSLRDKVKKETEEIHRHVETLPIMSKIIDSTITHAQYANYLVNMQHIYSTIEHNDIFQELEWDINLLPAVTKDIAVLQDRGFSGEIKMPISIYCKYLEKLTNRDQIAAHAYVRYMADLSGGMILKKKIAQLFGSNMINVYNLDVSKKCTIIDYINTKIYNPELFSAEVHHAFMAYAICLSVIS